jgi:hypothetical protein
MILDNFLVFSGAVSAAGVISGQAANAAGSILSTNTVDTAPLTLGGNQTWDIGAGEPLEVAISILTAPTVGTSVQFQLIQADDAALSSNVQVICQTDAIPIATLTAGQIVALHYDRAAPYAPKRYVGVRYVNVGAIATASYFATTVKNLQDLKNIYGKSGYAVL